MMMGYGTALRCLTCTTRSRAWASRSSRSRFMRSMRIAAS